MKTLTDEQARGQLCDECKSEEVVAEVSYGPENVTVVSKRMDEIEKGDYLFRRHRHGNEVYCVSEIDEAHDTAGHKSRVIHCSRGFTLTGTLAEAVEVLTTGDTTRLAE